MKPGISVCFVIKDAITNGYPFWESLESCLPFADEIVISEGYSDDDTLHFLKLFAVQHPGKVEIFHDYWGAIESPNGEAISVISNLNLRRCKYEWIYYLQADEIIHPGNYSYIRMIADNDIPVNSVEFWFVHFLGSWIPIGPLSVPDWPGFYNVAIRMVRNRDDIQLRGDAWTFGGETNPAMIAELAPRHLYHLAWVFPENILQKRMSKANIYTRNVDLQKGAAEAWDLLEAGKSLPPLSVGDLGDVPPCVHRLVGMPKYIPPPQAFESV